MSEHSRMLFVNIAVADLARARAFYASLGFAFDDRFCDETTFCLVINPQAFFMVMTHERFATFIKRPAYSSTTESGPLFAYSVPSREAVDETIVTVVANGGQDAEHLQDHGFMYARPFYDPDGNQWEPFWMDPTAVPPADADA